MENYSVQVPPYTVGPEDVYKRQLRGHEYALFISLSSARWQLQFRKSAGEIWKRGQEMQKFWEMKAYGIDSLWTCQFPLTK